MWNPYQPKRDLTGIDARTHIDRPDATYDVFSPKNMAAQLIIYRWAASEEFMKKVAIGDLHGYLFYQHMDITKRHMGQVIVQATTYNPRKLKGATQDNPKACMTYVWPTREDLVYGLEWQLSMWIWALEHEWDSLLQNPDRQEIVSQIFNEVTSCSDEDFESLYVSPVLINDFVEKNLNDGILDRPVWPSLWARHDWGTEGGKAAPRERPALRVI